MHQDLLQYLAEAKAILDVLHGQDQSLAEQQQIDFDEEEGGFVLPPEKHSSHEEEEEKQACLVTAQLQKEYDLAYAKVINSLQVFIAQEGKEESVKTLVKEGFGV